MPHFSKWKLSLIPAVLLLSGMFLFALSSQAAQDYSKPFNGTLNAADWNDLATDFVKTWTGATMTGPLGIGTTTPPASGLFVNGPIAATSFSGTYSGTIGAQNVSAGAFGSNTGGGNYSFPGNVGIGTTNPGSKLDIQTAGYGFPLTSGSVQTYGGLRVSPPSASGNVVLDMGVNTSFGAWLQTVLRTNLSSNYPLLLNPNGGNVGIGTSTPIAKLDVNGAIRWGGGQTIDSSDLVSTFPYDMLVASYWDANVELFRLMVDATSGNDNNDGLSWATAKATIQGALDSLPLNLQGYEARILVKSGNYGPINILHNNGIIRFIWMGTFINTSTHDSAIWYRDGTVNPIQNDNPIYVISAGNAPAIISWSDNLSISIDAVDERYAHYAAGHSYWGRWRFTTDGVSAPELIAGFYNKSVYSDNLYLDLGKSLYSGLAVEPKNGGTSAILSVQIIGGSGNASVQCNLWRAAVSSRTTAGSVILGRENTAAQGWAVGFAPPNGAWWDISGVRCLYSTWGNENKNLIFHPRTMYYSQGSLPDANIPQIYLESSFSGYAAYHPSYAQLNDLSTAAHTIYNYQTASEQRYVSKNIVDGGTNVGIGTTNPGSKLTLSAGDFAMDPNKSIIVNSSASTTLLLGNYFSGGFAYGTGQTASFAVEGDVKADRLCIEEDCKAAWSEIVSAGGGGQWATTGNNIYNVNSGNVGIGTTNPITPLDVAYASAATSNVGTGALALRSITQTTAANTGAALVFSGVVDGGGTQRNFGSVEGRKTLSTSGEQSGYLSFYTNNAAVWTEKVRIINTGNVGIGTTNPNGPLDVTVPNVTAGDASSFILHSGLMELRAGVSDTSNYTWIQSTERGVGHNNIVFNALGGNVGVGLTAPTSKLHVSGSLLNSLATTHSALGGAGNVLVMADNTGTLYSVASPSGSTTLPSGTSGQTLRHDGAVWVANSVLFNNGTSIGIGLTNPSAPLDVNGGIRASGPLTTTGTTLNIGTASGTLNAWTQVFDSANDRLYMGFSGAQGGAIQFYANGTSNGSTQIFYPSGNAYFTGSVGVGITNPSSLAHLYKAAGDAILRLENTGNGNTSGIDFYRERLSGAGIHGASMFVNSDTSGNQSLLYIQAQTAGSDAGVTAPLTAANGARMILRGGIGAISFENGATESVRFDPSGQVGIGLTAPGTKLDVSGTLRNSLATTHSLLGASGNVVVMADNAGTLYTSPAGSSLLWSGSTAGNIWNANSGNVGIGTTIPGEKLHVAGDVYITGGGGTIAGSTLANGWLKLGTNFAMDDNEIYFGSDGHIGTIGAFDLIFHAGGSEWIRLDSGGNVGIGTTNPNVSLHVATPSAGAVITRFENTSNLATGELTGLRFQGKNAGGTNQYVDLFFEPNTGKYGFGYGTTGANLPIASGLAYADLLVDSAGNVGIGLTAPGTKLDVSGSLRNSLATTHGLLGSAGNVIVMADNNGTLFSTSSALFLASGSGWTVNGATVYKTNISGNVGIGTTAPAAKLDIDNFVSAAGLSEFARFMHRRSDLTNADEGGYLSFKIADTNNSGDTFDHARISWRNNGSDADENEGELAFWTATNGVIAERMTINNIGNIGIGTTNPGAYRLKVAGNMAITGTLETQTGSDFAEEFKTNAELEPGTVVVLGDDGYKSAKPSEKEYDNKVIGVVSDNPSIIAGRSADRSGHQATVAMVGVVKVKVSAVNGAIRTGDLLTTSSLRGYAMKADANRPGTIIGKALEDLAGKRGEVKALVNLQ